MFGSLEIVVPFLPPTSNHIYVTNRWGRRFLSKEAKSFKNRFSTEVVPNYLHLISQLNPNSIYHVEWRFFFTDDKIVNKTFGAKSGAKMRYKKLDLTNRLKLIEDCLVEALAIDDSQFFSSSQTKESVRRSEGKEQVIIMVTPLIPEELGWEEEY